jgi:hypothetical protein
LNQGRSSTPPPGSPAWAVDFDARLRLLERDARDARTYAFDAWKMGEEARDAVKEAVKAFREQVTRIERCFRGSDEGPGVPSHRELGDSIGKLARGMDRLRKELKAKGHRGPNVEDSNVWEIPRDDPNAIVRGRGSWRIRLPSGKWRIAILITSHVVGGSVLWKGLLEPVWRLLHG